MKGEIFMATSSIFSHLEINSDEKMDILINELSKEERNIKKPQKRNIDQYLEKGKEILEKA